MAADAAVHRVTPNEWIQDLQFDAVENDAEQSLLEMQSVLIEDSVNSPFSFNGEERTVRYRSERGWTIHHLATIHEQLYRWVKRYHNDENPPTILAGPLDFGSVEERMARIFALVFALPLPRSPSGGAGVISNQTTAVQMQKARVEQSQLFWTNVVRFNSVVSRHAAEETWPYKQPDPNTFLAQVTRGELLFILYELRTFVKDVLPMLEQGNYNIDAANVYKEDARFAIELFNKLMDSKVLVGWRKTTFPAQIHEIQELAKKITNKHLEREKTPEEIVQVLAQAADARRRRQARKPEISQAGETISLNGVQLLDAVDSGRSRSSQNQAMQQVQQHAAAAAASPSPRSKSRTTGAELLQSYRSSDVSGASTHRSHGGLPDYSHLLMPSAASPRFQEPLEELPLVFGRVSPVPVTSHTRPLSVPPLNLNGLPLQPSAPPQEDDYEISVNDHHVHNGGEEEVIPKEEEEEEAKYASPPRSAHKIHTPDTARPQPSRSLVSPLENPRPFLEDGMPELENVYIPETPEVPQRTPSHASDASAVYHEFPSAEEDSKEANPDPHALSIVPEEPSRSRQAIPADVWDEYTSGRATDLNDAYRIVNQRKNRAEEEERLRKEAEQIRKEHEQDMKHEDLLRQWQLRKNGPVQGALHAFKAFAAQKQKDRRLIHQVQAGKHGRGSQAWQAWKAQHAHQMRVKPYAHGEARLDLEAAAWTWMTLALFGGAKASRTNL